MGPSSPTAPVQAQSVPWRWGLVMIAALGLVWLCQGIPAEAAHLAWTEVPDSPYLVWRHAPLLYVLTPLTIVGAALVFYAPGLHLVLAAGKDAQGAPVIVKAFVVSLVALAAWSALVTLAFDGTPTGPFLAGWGLLSAATWAVWARRLRDGRVSASPWSNPPERSRGWGYLLVPALTVIALLPVLFWQDLNADGAEALEIGRSLRWFVVPRFLDGNGFIGLGIGMIPMAFPVHWFDLLFGSIEASARLPLAVYLPALLASAVALIEIASPRRLRGPEFVTVALGIALFVFVLGYNASYDNYFADLSSPAAFEAFTVFTVLAAGYAFWADEFGWFLGLALLSFIARPTGVLLIGLLTVGAAWGTPSLRPRALRWLPAALLLWMAVFVLYEKGFVPWASGGEAGYGSGSILRRFQHLRFDHWAKFAYVVVPAGIVPALACLAVRRLDPIGRALLLATAGYFLVFYVPAFTNLHHFAPVMLLPVVIYWRGALTWTTRWWPAGAALAGVVVAGWLSRPGHFEVNQEMRRIGWATSYRIGDYDGPAAAYRAGIDGQEALYLLFRPEWEVADPARELVGGAHHWYYAVRPHPDLAVDNYAVLPDTLPAPDGYRLVGTRDGAAVFVRDPDLWRAQRYRDRRTDFRNPIYRMPREVRFRFLGEPAGRYQIDLARWPGLWRLF